MKYLLDTNILIDHPEIIEKNNINDIPIVVSTLTIDELDWLKESKNNELAFKARRASHYLLKYYKNIIFSKDTIKKEEKTDDVLLKTAKQNSYILLTSDINLCLKAKLTGVDYTLYNKGNESYTGIQYYEVELDENSYNEELDLLLQNGTLPKGIELCENEFLVITDQEDNTLSIFKKNQSNIEVIRDYYIRNNFIHQIAPRNREQTCLFNLLKDKNINILCAQGGFGVGKSFILINYALQELEKGNIDKIVFVPNNATTENTKELGYLPGDAYDKILPTIGTIVDIMGEDFVREKVEREEIILAPMANIRGRNFSKSIVIVNEAQNLTEDHIKLLVGRIGENSRIFFDGDIKQVDNSIFKNKNGLRLLTKLRHSKEFAPIFGAVKLVKTERSFTSRAADYLDNL